jgi:hypothetical protein
MHARLRVPSDCAQHSHAWCSLSYLIVHPSGDTVPGKARSKAQTCGAHGKVGDGEPEQGNQLRDDGNESENSAVELITRTLLVRTLAGGCGRVGKMDRGWQV